MATIPEPRPGLVFRYRYLRISQYLEGEQVGKERPCCILLPLKPGGSLLGNPVHSEHGASILGMHFAREGDVLIIPIQSDPPGKDQLGLQLSGEEKRYVGLSSDAPSYVIVSELNIDRWPNGDMCLVPGKSNAFAYERPLAGPVVGRIAKAFLRVCQARKLKVLVRHP